MNTKNYPYIENLMIIASLLSVKLNLKYVITDYSLIKPKMGNRGAMDERRVKFYLNLIKHNLFHFDLCVINVDKDGNITEGHHRFEAMKRSGMPVVINITTPKTLAQMSQYNTGISSNWSVVESFESAKTPENGIMSPENETVISIDKFRHVLCDEKYNIQLSKLKPNEIYGILMNNTKCFSSGKYSPTIDMWLDKNVGINFKKKEYKRLIDMYAGMKKELKNVRDAYKVCKKVMDLHFNDKIDFDFGIFYTSLLSNSFTLDVYNKETITAKVLSMYNKQKKLKLVA